jgi:hypothetical protein
MKYDEVFLDRLFFCWMNVFLLDDSPPSSVQWQSEEIPSELNIFGGGFSCKSFSKLSNEFESFKKALAEMMEDTQY